MNYHEFSEELAADLRRQLDAAQQEAAEALGCRDKALATAREEAGYAEDHLRRAAELRTLLRRHVDPENAELYSEPDASIAASPKRREFLDGMRKLIEYYDLHPDLPAPENAQLHVFPDRKPDAGPEWEFTEVARIAAAMGLTAQRKRPNHHFSAVMSFSKSVDVHVATTRRTDSGWKDGDELPQWFLHEQDTYAPAAEAARELAAEPQHAEHVESDAERGICQACGASILDGYCSNPQPIDRAEAVSGS